MNTCASNQGLNRKLRNHEGETEEDEAKEGREGAEGCGSLWLDGNRHRRGWDGRRWEREATAYEESALKRS
jgi:hypothetical protein